MDAQEQLRRGRLTYRYDLARAGFFGVMETGWQALGLYIAIEAFSAPDWAKAFIPASGPIGLLLTWLTISWVSRSGWPVARITAAYLSIAGALVFLAAISPSFPWYLLALVLAHIIFAQHTPMLVSIYSQNYRRTERGKRASTTFVIVAAVGAVFAYLTGELLDRDFSWYRYVLAFIAWSALASAFLISRIPSEPLVRGDIGNPWKNLRLVVEDRLFGVMLLAWMLMGIGNLMTLPIRVEYVANTEYGINAIPSQVLIATVLIPATARIVSAKVWGALFDRINFIVWRISINTCFMLGILFYFLSGSLAWIYVGSAFIGFGMGGGMIAWNLWVTKIAPPHKVSAYMSVHTSLTGLRGTLAPFIAYAVVASTGPAVLGLISALLVFVSSAIFSRLRQNKRFEQAF